jgi:hypothetical protein
LTQGFADAAVKPGQALLSRRQAGRSNFGKFINGLDEILGTRSARGKQPGNRIQMPRDGYPMDQAWTGLAAHHFRRRRFRPLAVGLVSHRTYGLSS